MEFANITLNGFKTVKSIFSRNMICEDLGPWISMNGLIFFIILWKVNKISWEIKLLNEPKMITFFINYKFKLFTKTFLLSVLLIGHTTIFCSGSEPIHSLDFLGNGPIFLSKKQISEDLNLASRLIRDNYVRHPIFEQHGISWEGVFQKLESLFCLLYTSPSPRDA